MQKRSIGIAVFLLAGVIAVPSISIADTNDVDDTTRKITLQLKESVLDNWGKLSKLCGIGCAVTAGRK